MTAVESSYVVESVRSLQAVRRTLPRELLRPNRVKAALVVANVTMQVVAATAFAGLVWVRGWWFLAPVSWLVGSIAATAMFILGHDCAHGSFLTSRRTMDRLGHVFMAPTGYPYWAWKYSHDAHHRHTNQLERGEGVYFDNAWNPYLARDWPTLDRTSANTYKLARRFPPIGSLMHMLAYHWVPSHYRDRHRAKAVRSMAFNVVVFAAIVGAAWAATGNALAFVHFWLVPALLLQLWMALYTFLHHTATDVEFLPSARWSQYLAQVEGTLNVLAPRWLSFLHLNIDVHIPHHISTRIACYNLRPADEILQSGPYGSRMPVRKLTFGYLRSQVSACQLWIEDEARYSRFRDQPDT